MKTKVIQNIFIISFILFLSFSCTTQNKKIKKNSFNKCNSNLKPKDTLSISDAGKDSILFVGKVYTNIFKFYNTLDKTYTIKNRNGKVLLNHLKYFSRMQGGFQVLNKANVIVYYNLELEKLTKAPEPELLGICGSVPSWKVKIEENEDYYNVKKLGGFAGSYGTEIWQKTDSIAKFNIKDIYFLNQTKNIEFDSNFYFPETIIIVYENSFGIRKNKKTFVFNTVDISNQDYIKVKCNNQYGYFETTEIKYKKLDAFIYNLAPFELDDGRKGYIDNLGIEYFK